jgi:hypothetical protein
MSYHRTSMLLSVVALTSLLACVTVAESIPQSDEQMVSKYKVTDVKTAGNRILKSSQIERLLTQAYSAIEQNDLKLAHILAEAAAEASIPADEFETSHRQILRVIENATLRKSGLADQADAKAVAVLIAAKQEQAITQGTVPAATSIDLRKTVDPSVVLDELVLSRDQPEIELTAITGRPALLPEKAGAEVKSNTEPVVEIKPEIIKVSAETPLLPKLPFISISSIDVHKAVVLIPVSEGEDPNLLEPENLARNYNQKHGSISNWEATQWRNLRPDRNTYTFTNNPLYFEDPNLERCGTSYGLLSDMRSAGLFFGRIPALPYMMASECPRECVSSKGDCPACHEFDVDAYLPELSLSPASIQAAAIVGLIFLVP